MKTSRTTCQRFVDLSLQLLGQQFPNAYIYHYMDDIMLAHSSPQKLAEILSSLQTYLNSQGLIIAPEKIQHMCPWKYLGFHILQKTITPLQFSFKVPEPLTHLSIHQFLGHLNWIQPTLGIPTYTDLPFPCGSAGKKSSCSAGDLGSIPELGRSPGEVKGYPLQYSGRENSMDTIHGVTKSQTQLNNFHFHFLSVITGK